MKRERKPGRSNARVLMVVLTCGFLGLRTTANLAAQEPGPPLPGTKPLAMTGDIASELVAGADRFLLRQIDESAAKRTQHWKRDFSSAEAYQASVEPNRKRLAHILGVRDARVPSVVRKLDTRHGRSGPAVCAGDRGDLSDRLGELGGVWGCDGRRDSSLIRRGPGRAAAGGDRDTGRGPDARAACRSGRGCSRRNRRWRAGWPRTAIA